MVKLICIRDAREATEDELRGLTFELSWHRQWDARARLVKCTAYLRSGPRGPPLGLNLSEGLGRTEVLDK